MAGFEVEGFINQQNYIERQKAIEAERLKKAQAPFLAAQALKVFGSTNTMSPFQPLAPKPFNFQSYAAPPKPTTIEPYKPVDVEAEYQNYLKTNPMPTPSAIGGPGVRTLKQARGDILREQQTQAAPGISKLRRALMHVATVAANEDNPARKKEMLRGIMEGTGTGISDIMGSAYNTALATVGQDISAQNQAAAQSFGARASQIMQSDAAKFGTWQGVLSKTLANMEQSNLLNYQERQRTANLADTANMRKWEMGGQLAAQLDLSNQQNWQNLYNEVIKSYLKN